MSDYKKNYIKQHVELLMEQSKNSMLENLNDLLKSGAIDIDKYDPKVNPMIEPKAIFIALMNEEINQYSAKGTSFEKQIKKEVKNLANFI